MSGKDVLKLLLIAFGFTKVNIRTYRGENNYIGYEIHATGDDGICYDEENCEGLMFNITHIIETMKDRGIDAKYKVFGGGDYSVKELLDMVDDKADTKDGKDVVRVNALQQFDAIMSVANQHRPYEPSDFVKEYYIADI